MGKKGSIKKSPNFGVGSYSSMTLREEATGKRQTNINVKSMLKLEHLQNLAVWAGSEASVLPLGAFFGHQFAALSEALGSQPDHSLISCQKCESILQPGHNCTVRIEKNTAKARHRRKKPNISPLNYVVYNCHFCSHRNLKRGTPRAHLKTICPQKTKPIPKPIPANSSILKCTKLDGNRIGAVGLKPTNEIACNDPSTPSVKASMTLLEARSKKRTRPKKKVVQCQSDDSAKIDEEKSVSISNRRKRKAWTSLKELAESNHKDSSRKLANLAIPFVM